MKSTAIRSFNLLTLSAQRHVCCTGVVASSDKNNLLLIIILSTLSAVFLVVVFVFIFCLCVLQRRRLPVVQRASSVSDEVAGLDHAAVDRLSYLRRSSSEVPERFPRRWFPEYGSAPSWDYLPAAWQQRPPPTDPSGRRDWTTYRPTDDLPQIVRYFLVISPLVRLLTTSYKNN